MALLLDPRDCSCCVIGETEALGLPGDHAFKVLRGRSSQTTRQATLPSRVCVALSRAQEGGKQPTCSEPPGSPADPGLRLSEGWRPASPAERGGHPEGEGGAALPLRGFPRRFIFSKKSLKVPATHCNCVLKASRFSGENCGRKFENCPLWPEEVMPAFRSGRQS